MPEVRRDGHDKLAAQHATAVKQLVEDHGHAVYRSYPHAAQFDYDAVAFHHYFRCRMSCRLADLLEQGGITDTHASDATLWVAERGMALMHHGGRCAAHNRTGMWSSFAWATECDNRLDLGVAIGVLQ